ncbi:RING finger domain-containing protein [Plectosphaerella cucumerina]|uniref:RING finger domain-containing protein n=1 Tax=Plectosphaerella cucumerina TaxID=40658 RepID=A0A8K0X6T5_9PEZI|nr:RING finger domain-containing protein [Plectosphaerella cucumerina]
MDSSTTSWSWDNLPKQPEPSKQEATYRQPFAASDEAEPSEPPPQPRQQDAQSSSGQEQATQDAQAPSADQRRRYRERTCRICLETVQPRFLNPTTGVLSGLMGDGAKPVYISPDDPDLGRLVSPCKCKGSQRYVHEGCLDAWRKAGGANSNFFTCPTCRYNYRIGRLTWARQLQSGFMQLALTAIIFMFAIFLLGFVAEPIFSLWNDPVGTIADTVAGVLDDDDSGWPQPVRVRREDGTWAEHFFNGFMSLGIVGFAKYLVGMTPWHWWVRSSGIMGGRGRRGGNRNRAENISWALVIVGAISFVISVWKAVGFFSKRILKMAGDTVLDVGGEDEDED